MPFESSSMQPVSFDPSLDADDEGIIADNPALESPEITNADHCKAKDNSIFGNMDIFRDFFLAAFSDGYYNVACCAGSCLPGHFPVDESSAYDASRGPTNNAGDVERTSSFQLHHIPTLSQSSSSSVREGPSQPRRKRPLAVPVGFKYAEDMNGRPIVITPGNRCMLVQNRRRVRLPTGSPASHHVPQEQKREINHSFFFPFQNKMEQPPMQLSYKPPPPSA